MYNKNKYIFVSVLLFLTIFLIGAGESSSVVPGSAKADVIRLHVIANSDTDFDQKLKLEVRDEILKVIGPELSDVEGKKQAMEKLSSSKELLASAAKDLITSKGYQYEVEIILGEKKFPTRLYGNQVYPAGNYDALQVIIGKGCGRNWWCVLFPPLCFSVVSEPINDLDVVDEVTEAEESPPARSYFSELWIKLKKWVKKCFSLWGEFYLKKV